MTRTSGVALVLVLLEMVGRSPAIAQALVPLEATIEIDDLATPAPSHAGWFIGSNTPAWIADRLHDEKLRARASAAGLGSMRIPGGAWSDYYGWLSCELRADQPGAEPCGQAWAAWVARPTDFIDFLRATGFTGDRVIYTLNVNATAEESAALVAFFNALPRDPTTIGTDRNGTDWRTAGYWAQLRSDHGNAAPLGIKYFEYGNEVYGSTPGSGGAECVAWGWENGWTCDGTEYVDGNASNDGYLAVRAAVRAVDSSVLVGAVGFEDPAAYSNWGNEVIRAAGTELDFYIIHPYAYYVLPSYDEGGFTEMLAQPQRHWATIRSRLNDAFATFGGGREVPIAVTEFNITSSQDQDRRQILTRAVNALFLADSIGQAMTHGFAFFNQWNLTNGCARNRTCYDLLVDGRKFRRTAQYWAFPLWSRFGSALLPVTADRDPGTELAVYAGRVDADTVALLAVNKTGATVDATLTLASGRQILAATADAATATKLKQKRVRFNGRGNPDDDLADAPPAIVSTTGAFATHTLAPYSITRVRLDTTP